MRRYVGSLGRLGSGMTLTIQAARRMMIALTILGVVTLAIGASFSLVQRASASPPSYDVCASGCPFISINDALAAAAPGATITVGPGTYGPNEVGAVTPDTQIIVNKPVTLKGAGIGTSIINDAPAHQGTASSGVITITTPSTPGNITISGFTIEGAIANDSNDDGILMNIHDTNPTDIIAVRDNLFYGDTTLDPQLLLDQTDAIVLQSTTSTTTVMDNRFQGVFRATLIEDNPGAFNFSDNDVNLHSIYDPSVAGQLDNWAEGLFFLADNGIHMNAPMIVQGNTFDSYQGMAIGLSAGYHLPSQTGAISNMTISSNTFRDTSVIGAQNANPSASSAILLRGEEPVNGDPNSTVSAITISDNSFIPAGGNGSGSSIELLGSVAGGISIEHNLMQGAGANTPPSNNTPAGIGFSTLYPIANISITQNIIRGYVDGASADTLPSGAQIAASQNCISGNSAWGFSAAGGSVDAQQNWWGSALGPSPTGPGTTLGYGNPVTLPQVDASNFLTTAPMAACGGPVVSNLTTTAGNPIPINTAFTVKAKLNTKTTSNAPIASAYYTIDGGSPVSMVASSGGGTFGTSKTMHVQGSTSEPGYPSTGNHTVCVYGMDIYGQIGSKCFTLKVVKASTTTTVTSGLNPSVYGDSVTFTITVASAAGAPTGAVALTDNATPLAGPLTLTPATATTSTATYTTSALAVGTHPLVATYTPDVPGKALFKTSTSATLNQVVNLVGTTTTVTGAPNPSVSGQTVTFTIKTLAADASALTGSVVLKDGATTLATVTLTNGAGTFATSALSVGTHNITAAYSGDATHDVSNGAATQTVAATPAVPAGSNNAYIRIVQSSEAYTSTDISIDGATTFPNVAACTAQPYYPITSGKHTFTVQNPSGGTTIITEGITLTAGQYYTLAVVGNNAKSITPAMLVFQDDNSVTPNKAKSRVYHLSDTLGPVLATSGSTTLSANLTFGNATSYTNQTPGTVNYSFQPSSGLALTDTLNESANQVYSIFLMCNGQVTNAAATGVPVALPQTGYGPTTAFWMSPIASRALLILGALLLLLGLGGFGSYFVIARRKALGL